MPIPSLQNISDSIPDLSVRVRRYFDLATDPKEVTYYRSLYAVMAIGASTINSIGYGCIAIPGRILGAFIHPDFQDLTYQCKQESARTFRSLYFTAAMTTYLFLSLLPFAGYKLRLENPFYLRPEATAYYLQADESFVLRFENSCLQVSGHQIFIDKELLQNPPFKTLQDVTNYVEARSEAVLILKGEEGGYLVSRNRPDVRNAIIGGTLVLGKKPLEHTELSDIVTTPPPAPVQSPTPSITQQEQVTTHPARSDATPSPAIPPSKEEEEIVPTSSAVSSEGRPSTPPAPMEEELQPSTYVSLAAGAAYQAATVTYQTAQSIASTVAGQYTASKNRKYELFFLNLLEQLQSRELVDLYTAMADDSNASFNQSGLKLYELLTQPNAQEEIRTRYANFVYALREARKTMDPSAPDACKKWIDTLCKMRFGTLELYDYCEKLVISASKQSFDNPVTLQNFWNILRTRNSQIKQMPAEEGIPFIVKMGQNFQGHMGYKDFLIGSNLPYIYGQLRKEKHVVTILRHGVPVSQSDTTGVFRRLWWGEEGNIIPEINPDYAGFIDAAARQDQKILHIVLENGEWKYQGDESARVQARLSLAEKPNFYPIALRLDGTFFHPHSFSPKPLDSMENDFASQVFGEKTGYFVPGKVRQSGLTEERFKSYIKAVRDTFFKDKNSLETVEEYQAFILLTYAEMILDMCDKLNVTYLEAHCKDDIDRGGVMKATLVLLHLYRTGKFDPAHATELSQMLQQLMVSIIAAPLIVKKQPIISSREILIKHVLGVLERTVQSKPIPEKVYEGNFNVLRGATS